MILFHHSCILLYGFVKWENLCKPTKIFRCIKIPLLLSSSPLFLPFFMRNFWHFPSHHSVFPVLFPFIDCFFLEFFVYLHQNQSFFDQIFLYIFIQRSVGWKGRSIVDFKDVWFKLFCQNNIKTQNLKTHVRPVVLELARPVLKLQLR